jgi:hypothetical protein
MITAQPTLFTDNSRSASFDRRRIYRYTLWRHWGEGNRYVNFICLNPSTADETANDKTVLKCIKFARRWGYDALCITNLFAYRATDFSVAAKAMDPIGYGNDRWLLETAEAASLIVCAWSQHGGFACRAAAVKKLLYHLDLHYLQMGKGQPCHPLYLLDATRPSRWHRKDR